MQSSWLLFDVLLGISVIGFCLSRYGKVFDVVVDSDNSRLAVKDSRKFRMPEVDNQSVGVIALMLIAFCVLFFTKIDGLDVVTNVVCTIGGIVTGKALAGT